VTATEPDPMAPPDPRTRAPLPQTSGLAVASLVLAFLPTCGIGSILAIVFGVRARREIDAPGSAKSGRGLATAGIVIGGIGLVSSIVVAVLVITAVISGASVR
jgi:hypothetical protein